MLEWLKKKFNKNEEDIEAKEKNAKEEAEVSDEAQDEPEAIEVDTKESEESLREEIETVEPETEADEEIEEETKKAPEDNLITEKYSFDNKEKTTEAVAEETFEIEEEPLGEEQIEVEEIDESRKEQNLVDEEVVETSESSQIHKVEEDVSSVSEDKEIIEPEDAFEVDTQEELSEDDEKDSEEGKDDFVDKDLEPKTDANTNEDDPEAESEIAESVEEEEKQEEEKVGWFGRLKKGLSKTRDDMNYKINDILGNYVKIDDDMIEDLEDLLISSDIGMETTMMLIDNLRDSIREKQIQDPKDVKPLLAEEIRKILEKNEEDHHLNLDSSPSIILIVGVNGVGKTTTIGKLAHRLKSEGKSVLIAAADTFRAAAIEQVETWGERSGVPVISHKEGADPAAVVFDAIQAQKARNIDVLICDTAGRLHNKKNLMNELEKIHRIIEKESPDAQKESLLVLDATTGQNAILQAKSFDEVTHLTGIVLTKLDGTAKGGVVLPLTQELDIPIKLIGVGEGMNDLQEFSGKDFADALVNIE